MDETLKHLLDGCLYHCDDDTRFLVAADRAQELGMTSLEWILRRLGWSGTAALRMATGSRVYGTPGPDSDWDFVKLTNLKSDNWWAHCDQDRSSGTVSTEYTNGESTGPQGMAATFRYGPLNLILCDRAEQFDVWTEGTQFLLARAGLHGPCTREEAIAVFSKLRSEKLR
jgi:hypothetical protein